ncbi:MAG: maleylpyruvate isomerase N-terminal domain-containing protein [Acidimicrobiia bacterium]
MPDDTPRPTAELAAVDAAFGMLLDATAGLTDEQARQPSLLPGWTRGHVLTHLARSGEGDLYTVEGAIRGEVLDKYPGGGDQRTRDIEAGAGREAAALRADLMATQHALTDAWARVEDGTWDRMTRTPVGPRTVAETVHARRREILVHLVDLDVGVSPSDLPSDYVEADRDWLVEYRTPETWPDATW